MYLRHFSLRFNDVFDTFLLGVQKNNVVESGYRDVFLDLYDVLYNFFATFFTTVFTKFLLGIEKCRDLLSKDIIEF